MKLTDKIEITNEDNMELMKRYPDNYFDLIITDPPYLFNKSPGKDYSERNQSNVKSKFGNSELYNWDNKLLKEMSSYKEVDLIKMLNATKRLMNPYNGYFFCSEAQIPFYCRWATENKLMFSVLVWEKQLSIINKNRYSQNVEYIVRVYDYGTGLNKLNDNKLYNRVKRYNTPTKKIHPAQKPTELIRELIKVHKKDNFKILDIFLGSGSTALSCFEENVTLTACELDKDYYEASIKRIKNHINQQRLF